MKPISILTTLLSVFIIGGCGGNNAEFDASGVFEATEITVPARATGEIMTLNVEEGTVVKASVLLGCIDTTGLELEKSRIANTRFATESRRLGTHSQLAALRRQIENRHKELARYENLLRDGAATAKQVDDIRYQIDELQRTLAASEEQLKASNSSIDRQSLSLKDQMMQVDDRIKNAEIASPVDGVVLAKYAEPGEWASLGKPLFKVADLRMMKLRAYITAAQLTRLRLGQTVKVYADRGENDRKEYKGTVTWISDRAEFTPKTIQTRDERVNLVYAIKVSVKNDGLIKRGMYGDIKF